MGFPVSFQVIVSTLSCDLIILFNSASAMRRPVGIFTVKVLKATKLKKKDLLGGADPYVKLKLTEDKLPSKKTTVKHKTLNPEWNEEFHLVVRDPATQALELMVYDWEKVWLFVSTSQRKGYSFPLPMCLFSAIFFFPTFIRSCQKHTWVESPELYTLNSCAYSPLCLYLS